MKQLSSISGRMEAANHLKNSAMEADTISKNGRSSKSHTSRGNFLKVCFALLTASIIILSINACTSVGAQSSSTKSERWEYKLLYINVGFGSGSWEQRINEANATLNDLGKEGWELVSTMANSGDTRFVFKRKLP